MNTSVAEQTREFNGDDDGLEVYAAKILLTGRQLPDATDLDGPRDNVIETIEEDYETMGILERQVLARKEAASEPVQKLVCDELDGDGSLTPCSRESSGDFSFKKSMSRGRSVKSEKLFSRSHSGASKAIYEASGRSRSKSVCRTKSIVRVGRAPNMASPLQSLMSNGEGTQRYARTRGKNEPPTRIDVSVELERLRKKRTVDVLKKMAEEEDDDNIEPGEDSKVQRRVPAIRFAA